VTKPRPYYSHGGITIYHGDSLKIVPQLDLSGVGCIVSDPPYGYGHTSGWGGKFKGREIAGDNSTAGRDWFTQNMPETPSIWFGTWKVAAPPGAHTCCVWDKGPASGMGDLSIPWKPSWELFWVIGKGWDGKRDEGVIKGCRVPTWSTGPAKRLHPTEKPVGLMARILSKAPPGVVLDPFMGAGSTLRAAKDLGLQAIGIELEREYIDAAVDRLRQEVLL